MRQCLELVYDRKSSKEIAHLLTQHGQPLSEGTVSGYIADAVRLLGARNRRDAAEMLHAHLNAPKKLGVDNLRDDPPAPAPAQAEERDASPSMPSLPIRRKGAANNDLSIRERLAWIVALAIGIAVGIGGIANALDLVDRIFHRR